MEQYPKFLKGIGLVALATAVLGGPAYAVPMPTYPSFDPGSAAAVTTPSSATVASAPGARILFRTSERPLARGTFSKGDASYTSDAASIGTTTQSRSRFRYLIPGIVLAALTPLALHHSDDAGAALATQKGSADLGSSSLPNLGESGDNGDSDHGDEVCDTGGDSGDHGDSDHGDSGDNGDCDNGGGGGGDGAGGGGGGGGGASLPEPGTVPLVGAGLMIALAFRSRRER